MVGGGGKKKAKPRVGETTVVESPTRAWSCRGLEVLGGAFGGVGINEIIRVNERHKRTLCRRQHILYIPRDGHRTSIAPDGILKFEHSGQKRSVGVSWLRWREHGDLKRL